MVRAEQKLLADLYVVLTVSCRESSRANPKLNSFSFFSAFHLWPITSHLKVLKSLLLSESEILFCFCGNLGVLNVLCLRRIVYLVLSTFG
jgi:hypothetical protein